MSLPVPANVTFDLFRDGKAPPADDADVVGAPGFLSPAFHAGLEAGEGLADPGVRFTHILLVATDVDIRDDYNAGVIGTAGDTIFVPDPNGTAFRVVFVERRFRATAFDHLRVYLQRLAPTWPTNEL